MRVLLLNPPTENESAPCVPPLGLAYLAAVLRENHIEVNLFDLDLERGKSQNLIQIIQLYKPQIVGISALTMQIDNAYYFARQIKGLSKNITVVAGGAHPSSLPEQTLREAEGNIDIVVIGEGEFTLLDIVNGKAWPDIAGIAFNKAGVISKNAPRQPIVDLDALPLPARDMLPIEKYRGWGPLKKVPTTHLIASRGCPFECIFCSEKAVFGRGYRMRSPKNTVDEISHLIATYKIKEFTFYDDLFTLNKNHVLAVCDEMRKRNIRVAWKTLSRVDTVDLEMLKKMKDAGCWMIAYGFESGSQQILNAIKKHQTVEQCVRAAELTHQAGIRIFGFFMIGNLGETKETIHQTIQMAKKIMPEYYQFTIVRPDPGSALYNSYKQEIESRHTSWANYYAFPDKQSKMFVVGTQLTMEELLIYRQLAYLSINLFGLFKETIKAILTGNLRVLIKLFIMRISKKA